MTVRSLLQEAIFGKRMPASTGGASLAGALTSGFYEVSQAMNTTAGDMQSSLDLIASASFRTVCNSSDAVDKSPC